MRCHLLCLSLLLLVSCATKTQEFSSKPTPAVPQPTALKDGLAVRYIRVELNSIQELKEWLTYEDGEAGPPLETLTYYTGKAAVLTSGKEDFVGAHITGYLQFETPGQYRFQVTNNDGVRVQVGGAVLYDDPKVGVDRTSEPISVEVAAPGWYPVEIWYFEKKGTSTLDVLWSPPGSRTFEMMPAEVLGHG